MGSLVNQLAGFQSSGLQHSCFSVSFANILLAPILPDILLVTGSTKCKFLLLSFLILALCVR